MLRLIFVSVLLLLLCSCVQNKYVPDPAGLKKTGEFVDRRDAEIALWNKKFNQLPGTHIRGLIQAWGKPEKLGSNEYLWAPLEVTQGGGYYEPDGHTTSKVYKTTSTGVSKHVGYIDTPKERYVEPYTNEFTPCKIRITTNKNGIITHVGYDSVIRGGTSCERRFPIPEK